MALFRSVLTGFFWCHSHGPYARSQGRNRVGSGENPSISAVWISLELFTLFEHSHICTFLPRCDFGAFHIFYFFFRGFYLTLPYKQFISRRHIFVIVNEDKGIESWLEAFFLKDIPFYCQFASKLEHFSTEVCDNEQVSISMNDCR